MPGSGVCSRYGHMKLLAALISIIQSSSELRSRLADKNSDLPLRFRGYIGVSACGTEEYGALCQNVVAKSGPKPANLIKNVL